MKATGVCCAGQKVLVHLFQLLSNQMTDTRFDHLWNLIDALSDRIGDLETEVRGLNCRADKVEHEINRLDWWISHD